MRLSVICACLMASVASLCFAVGIEADLRSTKVNGRPASVVGTLDGAAVYWTEDGQDWGAWPPVTTPRAAGEPVPTELYTIYPNGKPMVVKGYVNDAGAFVWRVSDQDFAARPVRAWIQATDPRANGVSRYGFVEGIKSNDPQASAQVESVIEAADEERRMPPVDGAQWLDWRKAIVLACVGLGAVVVGATVFVVILVVLARSWRSDK